MPKGNSWHLCHSAEDFKKLGLEQSFVRYNIICMNSVAHAIDVGYFTQNNDSLLSLDWLITRDGNTSSKYRLFGSLTKCVMKYFNGFLWYGYKLFYF